MSAFVRTFIREIINDTVLDRGKDTSTNVHIKRGGVLMHAEQMWMGGIG